MAGVGLKIVAGLAAIPLQRFVNSRLEASWRSTTGTEPPSMASRKDQIKANKEAEKLGLLPRPIEQPKLTDTLMWTALTTMSIVTVKWVAERAAEEGHRLLFGSNPNPDGRTALMSSTDIGTKHGVRARKQS